MITEFCDQCGTELPEDADDFWCGDCREDLRIETIQPRGGLL